MYHPNSLYGRLQARLEGNYCFCDINTKPANRPFCLDCYNKLYKLDFKLAEKLKYSSGESRLDIYEEAIKILEYEI
jgi:hypothetical protein